MGTPRLVCGNGPYSSKIRVCTNQVRSSYEGSHPSGLRRSTRALRLRQYVSTRSTHKGDINVEICSNCHPFFTGKQKLMDTAGRVERFRRKYAKAERRRSGENGSHTREEISSSFGSFKPPPWRRLFSVLVCPAERPVDGQRPRSFHDHGQQQSNRQQVIFKPSPFCCPVQFMKKPLGRWTVRMATTMLQRMPKAAMRLRRPTISPVRQRTRRKSPERPAAPEYVAAG